MLDAEPVVLPFHGKSVAVECVGGFHLHQLYEDGISINKNITIERVKFRYSVDGVCRGVTARHEHGRVWRHNESPHVLAQLHCCWQCRRLNCSHAQCVGVFCIKAPIGLKLISMSM